MRELKVVFVMEQHLGHRTFYQNLRRFVDDDGSIRATWVEVDYAPLSQLLEAVPMPQSLRGMLRGRAQVVRALKAGQYDVAFFNTHVPAVLGGSLSSQLRYVMSTDITPTQYDAIGRLYGRTRVTSPLVHWLRARSHRRAMQGAARILPWSTWTKDSLVSDYSVDTGRIDVLPPGVDLDRWCPSVREGRDAMAPLKILFVGGDFLRKGGPLLLEAFAGLPPGVAELHLVTRTPIERRDGVFVYDALTPNHPELISLFQRCDLFVLPTLAEAFGIVAVEASACGLPIIATAVGGLRDIVAHGETGYLLEPGDGAALQGHLRELIDRPELRRAMGVAARRRAEACFDARETARRVVALIHQCAAAV